MNRVNELHDQAMKHSESALMARMRGETELAVRLSRQALKSEISAINAVHEYSEPTYSILCRSAGTLALDCNDLRMAERLAAQALAKDPPPDVAQELRDLLEQVNFHRHLELKGVSLEESDMQINLTGSEVGYGFIKSHEFLMRVNHSLKLIQRIAERKNNKAFRETGPVGRDIAENYAMYLSVPRAASFSVTLNLCGPNNQQFIPGIMDAPVIVDEFMDLMELAEEDKIPQIRERISEQAYFNNFIGLAKKIAPDGERIKQVGFTVVRGGSHRSVALTKHVEEFKHLTQDESSTASPETVKIQGTLRYADATQINNNKIKVIDEKNIKHLVKVPKGMMNDIVSPLWNSPVEIIGIRKPRQKQIILKDIKEVTD